MELAKRMLEKDRADKLSNYNTSAGDQKSVNEVSYFDEHTKVTCKDITPSYCRHIIKFKGFKM